MFDSYFIPDGVLGARDKAMHKEMPSWSPSSRSLLGVYETQGTVISTFHELIEASQ